MRGLKYIRPKSAELVNPAQVQANRSKKLNGSYGMTTVIPMASMAQLEVESVMDELTRRSNITQVQPKKTAKGNQFVSTTTTPGDLTEEPLIIAKIDKLHTTIAGWQVLDANEKLGWDNQLVRSRLSSMMVKMGFDVFTDPYRSLLYNPKADKTEGMSIEDYKHALTSVFEQAPEKYPALDLERFTKMVNEAAESIYEPYSEPVGPDKRLSPFTLKASSIKLNNDGNIVIQWESNEDLRDFRRDLAQYGGLSKYGDQVATTVAYFPNWDKMTPEQREEIAVNLESIVSERNFTYIHEMSVDPEILQQVTFSRNDLSPNNANWDDVIPVFDVNGSINSQCLRPPTFENVDDRLHVELGIVIELPEAIYTEAVNLNRQIERELENVPGVEPNIDNHFHVSLYQGRYSRDEVYALQQEIEAMASDAHGFSSFDVPFQQGVRDAGVNIFWDVEKDPRLQRLHEKIIQIGLSHIDGMMTQFQKIKKNLIDTRSTIASENIKLEETMTEKGLTSDSQQKLDENRAQIANIDKKLSNLEKYKTTGAGPDYRPHVTVYYGSQGDKSQIEEKLKDVETKERSLRVETIGIAVLRENGSVTKVLSTTSLPAIAKAVTDKKVMSPDEQRQIKQDLMSSRAEDSKDKKTGLNP